MKNSPQSRALFPIRATVCSRCSMNVALSTYFESSNPRPRSCDIQLSNAAIKGLLVQAPVKRDSVIHANSTASTSSLSTFTLPWCRQQALSYSLSTANEIGNQILQEMSERTKSLRHGGLRSVTMTSTRQRVDQLSNTESIID